MTTPYRLLVAFLLLAIVAAPAVATADVGSPRGTEFWLSFMERLTDESDPNDPMTQMRLEIVAADSAADVVVTMPGNGWSAVVSLPPHGAGTVLIPSMGLPAGSERTSRHGIHVVASTPVTVIAFNHHVGSADATTVLPVEALGREYVVATYDPYIVSSSLRGLAEFVVVAPEDGTIVEITPTAPTERGRPAGVPFTVALQRGQTYQVQSSGNLTGTRVRTVGGSPCDRIAVFSGNVMALVGECNSVDHLYEQMLPVSALRQSYLFVPFAGRVGGDVVEVVAVEDSTFVIDWRGGPATRLDAGQRVRMLLDTTAHIQASKPIAVLQYARGRACDGADVAEGDPMLVQLRPRGWSSDVDVVAPGTLSFTRHWVTIITYDDDTASVRIDGVPVTGFGTFPNGMGQFYAWARVAIEPGAHLVTGARIEYVTLYGSGPAVSYAVDLTSTSRTAPTPADAAITLRCTCEGPVLEAPAGFTAYRWSNGDTTRTIVARASGTYAVTVGAEEDCTITSDSLAVVVEASRGSASLEPRRATVDAGEIIPYTLVVTGRSSGATCPIGFETVALRFRATMLLPDVIAGARIVGDSLDGADRILTLRPTRDTVLLDMTAAFGDTVSTAIVLERAVTDSCRSALGDTLSVLTFTGCEVGGRRLFIDREAAAIKAPRPEPVRGISTIGLRTLERGRTRLEVIDARGDRVATLLDAELEPGEHEAALDATGLAGGVYLLVMRTPSGEVVRRIAVE